MRALISLLESAAADPSKIGLLPDAWHAFHLIAAALLEPAFILQLLVLLLALLLRSEPKLLKYLGVLVAMLIFPSLLSSIMVLLIFRGSNVITPAEFILFPLAALGFQLLMLYKHSKPEWVGCFGSLSLVLIFLSRIAIVLLMAPLPVDTAGR